MLDASSQWRELLQVLEQFTGGKLGPTEASRAIEQFRVNLNQTENPLFFPFVAHDDESSHFPLGGVREHWSREALAREDADRERLEAAVRPELFEAAKALREYAKKHAI